ncbi:Hpt domain-containing protein [Noviherbaspirillum galbum]|uniref:Hpt domain-containing protein n=1 Tax=Noviherbaspirillum galbum TaxID=2709383 RepID=A0A6B3SHE7_9BURK|nr:Hpt domain-containing protein [Noviherbaspirillum galbum]NEX60274.1 Hpt domain-containing protein [Noviherbaspirillum galbum]
MDPRKPTETDSHAIDAHGLEEAAADFGAVYAELAALYCQDNLPRLARMRGACARGDLAELAGASHALAGSSASIGARGLAASCKSLERLAREPAAPDPADVGRRIDAISAALEGVIALLGQYAAKDSRP